MTGIRKAAAVVGGAAALALALGFGGVAAVDNVTASAPTSSSVNGTPALSNAGRSAPATDAGSGVHTAVLTGCIITPGSC